MKPVLDDAERLGLLKAMPLFTMLAVTDNAETKTPTKVKDSDSDDSDEEIVDTEDIMPKHFDKDDAFFNNLSNMSRSNSAASLESENTSGNSDSLRPTSACTDASDTSSMNTSFDLGASGGEAVDESMFDAATLTCKICKKVLKNLRTFRSHKARHMGTLNHKCPDCGKCFEGRSAVSKHLVANHGRELQPHEITSHPTSTSSINIIKPSAPEIKLFKPSEMAKKTIIKPVEISPSKLPQMSPAPTLDPMSSQMISPSLPRLDSAPVLEKHEDVKDDSSSHLGQMPILLENPESEVRYIVGSQLKPSDTPLSSERNSIDEAEVNVKEMEDSQEPISAPLHTSSPRRPSLSKESDVTNDDTSTAEDKPEDVTGESEKSVITSKLPQKLANFERIIPESDNSSDSDKSSSDTTSSSSDDSDSDSESDSDNDYFDGEPNKEKASRKKQPEEITLDDEDDIEKQKLNKSDPNQYHSAFESFLNKSKESKDSESDLEEDPLEQKRKTRQTSRRISSSPDKTKTKVVTADPLDENLYEPSEKAAKPKLPRGRKVKKRVSLSDPESSFDEEDEDEKLAKTTSKKDENSSVKAKKPKVPRGRKGKKINAQKRISLSDPESSYDEEDEEDLAKTNSKKDAKPQASKVSMVAAIFRAKKKKQPETEEAESSISKKPATRVLKPKAQKKPEMSDSENDKDITEDSAVSDTPLDKEAQDEADKLLEQKGVAVVGGKLMIPAHKLKIPDELCLIKTSGKGKGPVKKIFICQICDNHCNRADKMKYHLYNEHYDDFIRCSDSVPKILAKNHSLQKTETKPSGNTEKEKTISKPSAIARIFAKKNKTKTPPSKITEEPSRDSPSPPPPILEKHEIASPEVQRKPDPIISDQEDKSPTRGRRKAARTSFENESEEEEEFEKLTDVQTRKAVRRSSRSPRGQMSDDYFDQELAKERALIAPPSIKIPNISLSASVLGSAPTKIFGQEPFSNTIDSPFQQKTVPPKDEPSLGIASPTLFEPKFGSDKNLVTFADLAMKSKEQKHDSIVKPKGKPGRPKKVGGRKKVSARVSVEQSISSIEDTPTLVALQAAKEEAEKEEIEKQEREKEEREREEIKRETEMERERDIVAEEKKISEEMILDDIPTVELGVTKQEQGILDEDVNAEEDKQNEASRPTRSNIKVERIGISSSTLDVELHALRNLVFKEILETEPENISVNEVEDVIESAQENTTPDVIIKAEDARTIEQNVPTETGQDETEEDVGYDFLSREERFENLGERIISCSKSFATAIWHERKRLRLRKRKELTAILEKVVPEKRAKYRPKRHDYSLALLCSTNLYNNILLESKRTLQELKDVHFLVTHCSKLVSQKTSLFTGNLSKRGLKLTLKRLQHHKFSSRAGENLKLILSKEKPVVPEEPLEIEEEEDENSNEELLPQVITSADDSAKQKKSPPAKKLKVSKAEEQSGAPQVSPKKRGRKPKPKAEGEEKKVPKKRGRKPKAVAVATPGTSLKSDNDAEEDNKVKRPRKGRPKKLNNGDAAPSTKLNIQVNNPEQTESGIKLDKCDQEVNPVDKSPVTLSSEAEKSKDNIFEFEDDETNKVPAESSSSTSYKDMNTSESEEKKDEDSVPVKKKKIKRCAFYEGSGDEHQVPLKITFKRQSPEGNDGGKGRKSIKLRVKTQTTRDNGLKIQIRQPKTDNPLKFKVKAGSKEAKRKRLKIKPLTCEPTKGPSCVTTAESCAGEAEQSRESSSSSGAGKYSKQWPSLLMLALRPLTNAHSCR